MPYKLDTHVLTVDANVIHKVDTANPANLFSMWTDSVEQGRRLENLSWRLWQREQLVDRESKPPVVNASASQTNPSQPLPSDNRLSEVPQLSGSVESVQDEETVDLATTAPGPVDIRPRIRRLGSSTSSRGRRDRHISADDFEKMIVSIVRDKTPLSAPSHSVSQLASREDTPPIPSPHRHGSAPTDFLLHDTKSFSHQSSDNHLSLPTSVPPDPPPHRVGDLSPSSKAGLDDTIPDPKSSPASKPVQPRKPPARFALGGSCSSSEPDRERDVGLADANSAALVKKPAFQMGGSSEEESSLKSALHYPRPQPADPASVQKKQTSFSDHVTTRTIDQSEPAIATDTDADYVDESAIDDDDDSSDWEDSIGDSGKSSVDDRFFQRIPSKANLSSRPSLITLMLAQNERAKQLGSQTSQSTSAIPRARARPGAPSLGASPNDSDEPPLMMKGMRYSALKPISEIPRSHAEPIAVAPPRINTQAALSPRSTRRNMLATELTESLRRHLLWERQQKSSTANAVLKRRHTSHDVAHLKQYPERSYMKDGEGDAASWNQYFSKDALNGYHSKGW